MADKFAAGVSEIFAWLRQTGGDELLSGPAFKLGFFISQGINKKTRCYFVTQQTLAAKVGKSDRSIRNELKNLVARGHVHVTPGRGPRHPNTYRIVLKDTTATRKKTAGIEPTSNEATFFPYLEPETGSSVTEEPEIERRQTGRKLPTVPTSLNQPQEPASKYRSADHRSVSKKEADSAFESWWQQYPRRVAKNAARKSWQRIVKSGEAKPDELLAGAMRYSAERDGQDQKFTKHPATWLNGGCWADESDPAGDSPATTSKGTRRVDPLGEALKGYSR